MTVDRAAAIDHDNVPSDVEMIDLRGDSDTETYVLRFELQSSTSSAYFHSL